MLTVFTVLVECALCVDESPESGGGWKSIIIQKEKNVKYQHVGEERITIANNEFFFRFNV